MYEQHYLEDVVPRRVWIISGLVLLKCEGSVLRKVTEEKKV